MNAILPIVATVFLTACDSVSWTVTKVTADSMICTQWRKPDCLKLEAEGEYTFAINPSANTCSIMFENYKTSSRTIRQGSSLAYVDRDNWECKGEISALNLQMIANLSDGELSVMSVDLDQLVSPTIYRIDRTDTILGTVRHYSRWIKQKTDEKK